MLSFRLAVLLTASIPFVGSLVPSLRQDEKPVKVEVEVLELGAEPRQALRFAPRVGDEAELSLIVEQNQQIALDGRALPVPKAPALRMTMQTKAEEVDEAGLTRQSWEDLRFEIVGDADERMRQELDKMFAGLEGFGGSVRFDTRGFVHETEFEIPSDAAPMLKSILEGFERSMSEVVTPFPEEPVGLGAVWTVASNVEMNNVEMRSVSKIKLIAIDEDGVTLEIENEVHADAQKIEHDQLPPGAQLELLSCSGEGNGESHIAFRHMHPTSSTVESSVDMQMKTTMGEREQTMDVKISMSMETERKALETAK